MENEQKDVDDGCDSLQSMNIRNESPETEPGDQLKVSEKRKGKSHRCKAGKFVTK